MPEDVAGSEIAKVLFFGAAISPDDDEASRLLQMVFNTCSLAREHRVHLESLVPREGILKSWFRRLASRACNILRESLEAPDGFNVSPSIALLKEIIRIHPSLTLTRLGQHSLLEHIITTYKCFACGGFAAAHAVVRSDAQQDDDKNRRMWTPFIRYHAVEIIV